MTVKHDKLEGNSTDDSNLATYTIYALCHREAYNCNRLRSITAVNTTN